MKKTTLFISAVALVLTFLLILASCDGEADLTSEIGTTMAGSETTEALDEPPVTVTSPLTFYSTGHGPGHQDGHVFVCGDEIYVIDGGTNLWGEGTLYQYLIDLYEKKYGTEGYSEGNKLDINILLSHFHGDHVGVYIRGTAPLLSDPRFNVVSAYYPDLKLIDGTYNEKRTSFEELLMQNHPLCERNAVGFAQYVEIIAGDLKFELFTSPIDWSSDTAHDVDAMRSNLDYIVELYRVKDTAEKKNGAAENSNSMWTKVTYGSYTMLFTGDVAKKGYYAYDVREPFDIFLKYWTDVQGYDVFKVDILKFPHHGDQRAKALPCALDMIAPSFILFTAPHEEYTLTIDTPAGLMYSGAYAGTGESGILIRFGIDGTVRAVELENESEKLLYTAGGTLANVGNLFVPDNYSTTTTTVLSGEGTEASPYLISSADDLAFFAKHHADDKYVGKYFKLTQDIVWDADAAAYFASAGVSGMDADGNLTWSETFTLKSNWIPIGTYLSVGVPFTGTFDGAGFSISGIYCKGDRGVGFFGAVNGTVKNLTVEDSYFHGSRMVSAFVGHVGDGDTANIENCVNDATVLGRVGVGGIFGGYYNSAVDNEDEAPLTGMIHIIKCVNNGAVYGGAGDAHGCVGGIAGSLRTAGESSITYCVNNGLIHSNGGCIGGIVGEAIACTLTMTNCANAGSVTGLRLVGGIVGKVELRSGKNFSNLINKGNITSTSTSHSQIGQINGSDAADKSHADVFTDGSYYYLESATLTCAGSGDATGDIPTLYTAKSEGEINALIATITVQIPALNVAHLTKK